MSKQIIIPTIWPISCHTDYIGKNSTFVAIKGAKHDGISFVPLALKKGATTIVAEYTADISQETLSAIQNANAHLEFVPDARRVLALRAAKAWGNPARKLKIIGITGTKGKTTTSWLLHHMLQSSGRKTALLSTAGNKIGDQQFTTELTTQHPDYLHSFFHACVSAHIEFVVLEVAAQALTLHRVAGLEFDGIIFTNFASAHGEFYTNEQEYFAAKASLFEQAKPDAKLVINADDAKGVEFLEKYQNGTAFAVQKMFARVTGDILKSNAHGIEAVINGMDEVFGFTCPGLIGSFNLYNILAAATMAWRLGIYPEQIACSLTSFTGVPGRLERYNLPNGSVSFIDYAHNPLSFASVLPLLRSMTDHLIVIAGAGGDRDKSMRPIMGQLMAQFADHVLLTTDNPRSENPADIIRAICDGVPEEYKSKVICELDREYAIKRAYELSKTNSIIALLGKGPDEYQIFGTEKMYFSERTILKNL